MKPMQTARLLAVFGVSAAITTLLVNCQESDANKLYKPSGKPLPPLSASESVCSTITQAKTPQCTFVPGDDGGRILNYALTASRESVSIPVDNGKQPAITLNDALVYNKSLTPERLELRRGDELRINLRNELSLPPPKGKDEFGRFDKIGEHKPDEVLPAGVKLLQMRPEFSNLHTHGLVTAWDFKAPETKRGDNVLGILMNAKQRALPAGIDPAEVCSTGGDTTDYRYPISASHGIGLNWYHPHPHGTSGFQVEGGMSGLLMVGDEKAEKLLNPVYLQLKDMQASKVGNGNTYQFEKFEPTIATVCHDKVKEVDKKDGWAFDEDVLGRCLYHQEPAPNNNLTSRLDFAWLFLVNGQLFPTINVPEKAYLRLINSSANATYRLALEPELTIKPGTYYLPPFKVVEKDGTTTLEKSLTDQKNVCTLVMTPATRVGVSIDFDAMREMGSVCELNIALNSAGQRDYKVQYKQLNAAEREKALAQAAIKAFTLTQEGIDTGEDDWPAVHLASLVPDNKLPAANLDAYQTALAAAEKAPIKVAARTDVKAPDDKCVPTLPTADPNGDGLQRRHLALFFGGTGTRDPDDGSFPQEHFGLVADQELNEGTTVSAVSADTIKQWRAQYQNQFADKKQAFDGYNEKYDKTKLLEYRAPDLKAPGLEGLVFHKFRLEQGKPIHTNICTQQGNQPEHWRIHNLSAQIHNFHLHQMKFHVMGVRGAACMLPNAANADPSVRDVKAFKLLDEEGYVKDKLGAADFIGATDEQCVKTYAEMFHNIPASYQLAAAPPGTVGTAAAPANERFVAQQTFDYGYHDTFPVPPMGYIDIDVTFDKPEQVGEYVFHCHILEHEDAGMMGKIVVQPANKS
jgi:FtsP/CotA-like multicopper oxidase with cupredoxin domain